ncbi:MAG: shikimate kinase [Candidatus Riflebacteria bacterium]|nr:shikimate kinase [Candidatus Riflebacteria bacterium]
MKRSLFMPVSLIGFMCSGKTGRGQKTAEKYFLQFFDLDEIIEKYYGKKISEIFAESGESYFRNIESIELIKHFSEVQDRNYILATGGGTIESPENIKLLQENSYIVFLDPPFEILLERIKKNSVGRPMAKSRSDKELFDLWQKRREIYLNSCDCIITDHTSANAIEIF